MTVDPVPGDPAPEPTHLIHIGWAKAGSTFLQNWFATHPQIAYAPSGIAGCHKTFELIRQASMPGNIKCRVTSAEALSTPFPLAGMKNIDVHALADHDVRTAQAQGCRLLRQLFPPAKILIVTRGPRSVLLSAYSQYIRTGGDQPFPGFVKFATKARHWWDYDHVIRVYEQAFGAANVLVLPYEHLRDDPQGFCRLIEYSLGLAPGPVPRAILNRSIGAASLAWYPRFSRLLRWLPRSGIVRRLYWRAIVGDRLAGLAALLQRVHPLTVPGPADIPDDFLRTLARQCESLRNRPSYAPYLREYGLADEETP